VHIAKSLKAVLLAAVKEPVNRAFLISLDMVFNKVIQEVVSDNFTACSTFIAKCICDEVEVLLKTILAINLFKPRTE